jgi:hypothetical protein
MDKTDTLRRVGIDLSRAFAAQIVDSTHQGIPQDRQWRRPPRSSRRQLARSDATRAMPASRRICSPGQRRADRHCPRAPLYRRHG